MTVNFKPYVESFIESLKPNPMQQELAKVLFKSKEDCTDFYIGYLNRNRYVIDDLYDYREKKLESTKLTLDMFLDMCYNINIAEAIKVCFLQPISLMESEIICKAIKKGEISLKAIYNEFLKNPDKNVLKNVL